MTCNELFERFIKEEKDRCKLSTCMQRRSILKRYFLCFFGNRKTKEITFEDINMVYDFMDKKGYKQGTIFGTYAALSKYFNYAIDKGEISQTPLAYARRVTQYKKW